MAYTHITDRTMITQCLYILVREDAIYTATLLNRLCLALWYTREELGFRMAQWFGFAAVAG